MSHWKIEHRFKILLNIYQGLNIAVCCTYKEKPIKIIQLLEIKQKQS